MLLILKDKRQTVAGAEKTIKAIADKLQKRNTDTVVASFDDVELFIEKGSVSAKIQGRDLTEFSTIFFRRVGEKRTLAFIISQLAAKNNIQCIDSIYKYTNEPGKLKQAAVLANSGVSVPKTYYAGEYSKEAISRAVKFLGFPVVVKNSKGQRGSGVFLAKNEQELENILIENEEAEIFFQEFIPNLFDYRILVLGKDIACAEKRTRTKEGEFRNNVYLGAKEEFIEISSLDDSIQKLAQDAAQAADIQVAGVDIVQDENGQAYVFEVNRAPAFTHDEDISPELNLLAEYLIQCEKKNSK